MSPASAMIERAARDAVSERRPTRPALPLPTRRELRRAAAVQAAFLAELR